MIYPAITPSDQAEGVFSVTAQFQCLSVDDQLGLLWDIYTKVGCSFTPAVPGNTRLQLAQGLLNQIKQMSNSEQLAFLQNLIAKVSTPLTRAYGTLTNNTKLAFWSQLVELMKQRTVVSVPANDQLSAEANAVLFALQKLDLNQQTTILRNIVASMGVDPLA